MANRSLSYDPGVATTPRALGGHRYAVDSFRGEGKSYTVNLQAMTCDCPHYQGRLAGTGQQCKHLVAVIEFTQAAQPTALAAAAPKAARLTDEELQHHAAQRNGTAAGCACLLELAARRLAADRDTALKAVFA